MSDTVTNSLTRRAAFDAISLYLELFSTPGQHDDDTDVVLPDQTPEVVQRVHCGTSHTHTHTHTHTQKTFF